MLCGWKRLCEVVISVRKLLILENPRASALIYLESMLLTEMEHTGSIRAIESEAS